jgi:iron complex outermembrane receptor protein
VHFFNGRLDLNTAIYHQVRENYAISRPGGVFDQASEITSNGFEIDVTTTPVSRWRINGGYAFTHAEFGDYLLDDETNLKGTRPVFAPRHTFNVWTAYDWANGVGINVGARALSSQFGDRFNVLKLDGYGMLNAAVRYTRGPLEYAININNLTDTEYIASTLYDTQVYPGEPINVLGTVRVRFR